MTSARASEIEDVFVIGGGVNGCGIARDAAGRGLRVTLAEMNDLASATSSASTKLLHGGLRYLEFFEIRLVRKALKEREILLQSMPHISWPMRFVLPYHKDMRFESDTPASRLLQSVMPWMAGRRPAWMIRVGLFLYDHLGGRKVLPATRTVNLTRDPAGRPLKSKFKTAFEYSDCWVEDSRLVVLSARDAQARGAQIWTGTKVIGATRKDGVWDVTTRNQQTGQVVVTRARALVNAAGPWVEELVKDVMGLHSDEGVRLVRGSHIVTKKLFDHDKCYFFQGQDGRIIFAIPYEGDFTLIGTTDHDQADMDDPVSCSDDEATYLRTFASEYFKQEILADDIVWRYAGVRPLYDDGATSATAATRDYVVRIDRDKGQAPLVNVFGGKITTYRQLSEHVMDRLAPQFTTCGTAWTAGVALPGGDFPVAGVGDLISALRSDYPFLTAPYATRLIKAYGTEAQTVLGDAKEAVDLGQMFGASLSAREVTWMMTHEYARTAEDVVWRRTRLGLWMSADEIIVLGQWMAGQIKTQKHDL